MPNRSQSLASNESMRHLDNRSLDLDDDDLMGIPGDLGKSKFMSQSTSETDESASEKRDEVQEIRNRSRKEDRIVRLWRSALLLLILVIGATVSGLTFHFLQEEEHKALNLAYDQFSDALSDAAIRQQQEILEGFRTLATIISDYAATSNQTWPFVDLPKFEAYAEHILKIAGTEAVTYFPIVTKGNQDAYLNYTGNNHERVIKEAHMIENGNLDDLNPVGYKPFFTVGTKDGFVPDIDREVYYPMWQFSPPMFTYGAVNWNAASVPDYADVFEALRTLKSESPISKVRPYVTAGLSLSNEEHAAMHSEIEGSSTAFPHSFVFTPIYLESEDTDSPIVAALASSMGWDFSLQHLLPEGVIGIHAILKNSCGQSFSYEINGPDAFYLGDEDLHQTKYDEYERFVNLALYTHPDFETTQGHCMYSMHLYPDNKFANLYLTPVPLLYTVCIAGSFAFMIAVFFVYNSFVHKRNETLVANAARSNAVITSLFPDNIRNKIIGDESCRKNPRNFHELLDPTSDPLTDLSRPPLADYFATTTVMFADICGFTAWSSVREPSQVFTLLETVYGEFDRLTKHSKVFKVETVGDCYVAATGIPTYRKDHAVLMVKYAHKISRAMTHMTQTLETTLGPDTADLLLRIGIHSGPVTAGVIRGEKARFQLFGDTMNVAARVESKGAAGRIHVSQDTADHLRKCHKGHWLVKREGTIIAKGKGDLQTYWIGKAVQSVKEATGTGSETASVSEKSTSSFEETAPAAFGNHLDDAGNRKDRLVDWNVTVFTDILKQIVARRNAYAAAKKDSNDLSAVDLRVVEDMKKDDLKPLHDVRETIWLPEFDQTVEDSQEDAHTIDIPTSVSTELRDFISTIASLYRSNSFHNFEHASHVTMSVIKLLSRIKAPTDFEMMENENESDDDSFHVKANLHDHTYGITSDPLTQFACAFAALIHDVDHEGVTNAQLVKEGAVVAAKYENRSVAEQNSFVLAWNLFMSDRFATLREHLCATPAEIIRFRELAVNAVMATDIVDKDLKNLRNNRWDKAFKNQGSIEELDNESRESINRKATIVIEHLIQASDVSHTMQHWHVYRKWNERLFHEMHAAYVQGRSDSDPALTWYKGEMGFFDFYIIPLAKKLESCGVFGKSSDEFLNYARSNREEWEIRGEEIVAEMVASLNKRPATNSKK
ncbi:unnamed protein product [Cylindrotheca closterium]|uniref:Phosphodiesterase n=1 Tax=Cylindrotheca closterium TaxID=2856 RepID=A0AAD2CMU6_9STRA|nr:unnamed protein product [Cylindrotheca closterium]